MKLTKFEQSGFIFEADNGFRLALDVANKTPIEKLDGITCDAMLVSHIHGDHLSLEHIKALSPKTLYLNSECAETLGEEALPFEVKIIKSGEVVNIDSISVQAFDVDHGPNISAPLRENFGFLLNVDGQSFYFGGDIFYPSGIDVSAFQVDWALIPVGTYYTFGPDEALSFIKQFKQIGKVVPMHYEKNPETRDQFTALAQKEGFVVEIL